MKPKTRDVLLCVDFSYSSREAIFRPERVICRDNSQAEHSLWTTLSFSATAMTISLAREGVSLRSRNVASLFFIPPGHKARIWVEDSDLQALLPTKCNTKCVVA